MSAAPLTIIVPTLNAEPHLSRLDADLDEGRDLIGDRLISDGGSGDDTVKAARRLGWRVITGEPGRGRQLAAGAAAARTPWLLFLHADSGLCPGWAAVVAGFIADPAHARRAAYFRFALNTPDRRARRLETMVAWRCRLFALPYGDQGLLIAADFYRDIGGYRDWPLMEDVDLVRRLGQRRLAGLPVELKTGAERYQRTGYTRRILRNALCLIAYMVGIPPGRIARFYGYDS